MTNPSSLGNRWRRAEPTGGARRMRDRSTEIEGHVEREIEYYSASLCK
jgi:hypothetical protein